MTKPNKEERALIAMVIREKGYKNVKGVEKINAVTFKAEATRRLGKTVHYGLIVQVRPEGYNVGVDYAYS
ncbi:hypothetical protein NS115_03750 [Paenibacillus jamilae]|uniref:Uncharacterized protein n=1 Tax=Paenibacillus jamilae TaxID=114136 RepID=A0ACC4ZZR4_9BACL|nr:hypothetical protein [Paenibacillus jamilae]KTS84453.1 hypothetical protein NS115_03750 [Paenibacillus jamilae]